MTTGRALLEAYRARSEIEDQPAPEVLERIESDLAVPEARRRAAAAVILVASVAVAASVTAVVAWPRPSLQGLESPVSAAIDRAREADHTRAASLRGADPRPAPTPEPTPGAPPSFAPAPSVAPTPAPAPAPPTPEPTTVPSEDTLASELRLLQQAKSAMRDGRVAQAKTALREHGRSFPNGQLAEDREALWVVVRCGEDSRNTGRVVFEAAYPSSHHLVAIRAACEKK